jgi:ABC-type glycerol-3-phosphate transport system substrate-binding protein
MKTTLAIAVAMIVGLGTVGCGPSATTSKKTETTTETPGGETKTTIEQKTETTPDSATRTTTEKVEKSGENPPPAKP